MAMLKEKMRAPVKGPTGHARWLISAVSLPVCAFLFWLAARNLGNDLTTVNQIATAAVGIVFATFTILHLAVLVYWFRNRESLHEPRTV